MVSYIFVICICYGESGKLGIMYRSKSLDEKCISYNFNDAFNDVRTGTPAHSHNKGRVEVIITNSELCSILIM